jgi:MscS family membrane protein
MLNLISGNINEDKSALTIHPSIVNKEKRKSLASNLKHIFDAKGLIVVMGDLPKDPDYRDTISKNQTYTPFPKFVPEIYLEKVGSNWYYSESTCLAIDRIYSSIFPVAIDQLIGHIPTSLKGKIFAIQYWQYIGLFILMVLGWLLHQIFNYLADQIILRSKFYKKIDLGLEAKEELHSLVGSIVIALIIYGVNIFIPNLMLEVHVTKGIYNIFDVLTSLVILIGLFKLIELMRLYFKKITDATESKLDDQLLPIVTKLAKVIVAIICFFNILATVGVNVTALIAGISIGGLAIALAAQDTVKNFLGSVMIFFDKPFQIGDFIKIADIEGTVEEVGIRSTRIKKSDLSVVTVPNGNLSNMSLINLGIRQERMVELNIGLMYNTPLSSINSYIDDLRNMAQNHDKLNKTQLFIYLRHMSASSLDIFFRVYINTLDFKEELQIREGVINNIIALASKNKVSFAFPSTSVYIEQMKSIGVSDIDGQK